MSVKRILSALLSIAMLIPLLPLFSVSAPIEEDPPKLYSESSDSVLFGNTGTVIENYSEENFARDIASWKIDYRHFQGRPGLYLTKETEDATLPLTISKSFNTPVDLSSYQEMFFQILATKTNGSPIKLTVSFYSTMGFYSCSGEIAESGICDVYIPLSSFANRDSVNVITFTFECEASPRSICISSLFADDKFTYSHKKRFGSTEFSSSGKMTETEKAIKIAVQDSSADLSAVLEEKMKDSGTIIVRAIISNVTAGNVTLSVCPDEKDEYTDIATLTIFPGTNSYTYMYSASKGSSGYKLSFSGISSDNQEIHVESVSLSHVDEELYTIEQPHKGAISSCNLTADAKKVKISGTLQSSAVINNMGASLGVYATDFWGENKTEILDTIDISTVFDITADISHFQVSPYLCAFYVAIIKDDTVTPVCDPAYPQIAPSGNTSVSTPLGVQSHDSSVPFRSNVSQTVVDVDLTRLLSYSENGKAYVYGGVSYNINSSYAAELDASINFHAATGVSVILRVTKSSLSNNGTLVSVDTSDKEKTNEYSACLDYLTRRYTKISGVIVGSRINCYLYNRNYSENIIAYCKNYVKLLRITSMIVRANTENAVVIVPFGDSHVYDETEYDAEYDIPYDSISGMGYYNTDPMLVSEIISQFISRNGAFQWYIMYECESDPVAALNYAYKIFTQNAQGSGTTPSGHMTLWQPEAPVEKSVAAVVKEAIEEGMLLNTRGFILSLARTVCDEEALCNELSSMSFGDNSSRNNYRYEAVMSKSAPKTSLNLWDFTKSYSNGGFTYGGSVASLTTESSESISSYENVAGARALSFKTDASLGNSAVVVSYFDSPKDFSQAESINVNLCTDNSSPADVTVIIGKGNVREEFSARIDTSGTVTLTCPLENKDDIPSVDYFALAITSQEDLSVDVSRVYLTSSLEGEQLMQSVNSSYKTEFTSNLDMSTVVIVAFVILTLVGFALFSVKSSKTAKK